MKVSGYQLREAIKAQAARRDFAASQFTDVLKAFPDEHKPAPGDVGAELLKAEEAVAKLQVAQMRYNLQVYLPGGELTLAQAIKMIGGVGRAEKLWRAAAAPKKDRYSLHNEDSRAKDTLVAAPTVSRETAHELATKLARHAATLRQGIAVANATVIDVIDLDASLLA